MAGLNCKCSLEYGQAPETEPTHDITIPPYCERCCRNLRARYEAHLFFTAVYCEHCGDVLRIADRDLLHCSDALLMRLQDMGAAWRNELTPDVWDVPTSISLSWLLASDTLSEADLLRARDMLIDAGYSQQRDAHGRWS